MHDFLLLLPGPLQARDFSSCCSPSGEPDLVCDFSASAPKGPIGFRSLLLQIPKALGFRFAISLHS